jgi:hypothetical protein
VVFGGLTIIGTVLVSPKVRPFLIHSFGVSEQTAEVYSGLIHISVGAALGTIGSLVLGVVLPFVFIAQRAIAMETMGLDWASIDGDMHDQLRWYLGFHPDQERIKVLCISGRSLFRETLDGTDPPLTKWAKDGRLDVIAPISSASNPTVMERFETYSGDFRSLHYPNGVSDLVHEIEVGKGFLRAFPRNTLEEHDILCMWRVVILKDHCLVQSYFPNSDGDESDHAPLFVYQQGSVDSYYETYLKMFEFLYKHHKRPTEPVRDHDVPHA